jgi:hypothetical protein
MHSVRGKLKEVFLLECDGKSYRQFFSCLEKTRGLTKRQMFMHGLRREVFMTCFKVLFQQLPVETEENRETLLTFWYLGKDLRWIPPEYK